MNLHPMIDDESLFWEFLAMAAHLAAIEKIADQNIRKWILASHARDRLAKKDVAVNVGPYITLARETGAGGSELAAKVAKQLGWDVLDREIVDYLVEHYGTPRSFVELVDEKQFNWLGEIVTTWINRSSIGDSAYTHRLGQLLLLAAHHGNVVIVGRGARFFLPPDRGLSVRVLAPLEFRIEQEMRRQGINHKEARKWVVESDRNREAYVKDHFHKSPTDPHLYDLVVNVQKLTQDDAADLIVAAAQAWMKRSAIRVDA
ncbi:MAG: AAA family ATPase [Novipirellula sp. JB048]